MKTSTAPQAFLCGIEFYLNDGCIEFMKKGKTLPFAELPTDGAARLRAEIERDPDVEKGLKLLGIVDPIEQLKQFVFCQFGNFDNVADIQPDGTLVPEYWNCGCRPCKADGLICKFPTVKYGRLTAHEMKLVAAMSADDSHKIIADKLRRSKHTIDTEFRTIRHKIGCYTKAGISYFAGQNNIL